MADTAVEAFQAVVDEPSHVQIRKASDQVEAMSDEEIDRTLNATEALGLACRGEKHARRIRRARENEPAQRRM